MNVHWAEKLPNSNANTFMELGKLHREIRILLSATIYAIGYF